jgi:hypothetical protein
MSSRFKTKRPKWMLTHPDGRLMVEHALEGWHGTIYAGVLYKHDEEFDAVNVLKKAFGDRVNVVVIDESGSHSETVMKIIKAFGLEERPIIVRDCDNKVKPEEGFFNIVSDIGNFLFVSEYRGPEKDSNKGMYDSSWISVGVYGFALGKIFLEHFDAEKTLLETIKECDPYLETAIAYSDWGTQEDWDEELENHKTYFIDLDGVVFRNASKYFKPYWEEAEAIIENVEWIRRLPKESRIIFVTARPYTLELWNLTTSQLQSLGLSGELIMGLPHSQRVIINDNSPNAHYEACVAINTKRDGLIEDARHSQVSGEH